MMRTLRVSALERDATYRLLAGLVVPRPVAWVSTLSRSGVPNLAPFSFFTVVGASPPLLGVSINQGKARGPKDTFVNIRDTGEFVVNIGDADTVAAMEATSAEVPPEVDEFRLAGLTAVYDNCFVQAPRVAQAPAQFECVHERTVDFGEYAFVVGEVKAVHLREGLCDERLRIDLERFRWVGRLAGGQYCHATPGFTPPTLR
jgi:flavin reductase (DIM6/NTAB) family NADH-FMN oxidoreductase RutF